MDFKGMFFLLDIVPILNQPTHPNMDKSVNYPWWGRPCIFSVQFDLIFILCELYSFYDNLIDSCDTIG